jgi:hypothetical protein
METRLAAGELSILLVVRSSKSEPRGLVPTENLTSTVRSSKVDSFHCRRRRSPGIPGISAHSTGIVEDTCAGVRCDARILEKTGRIVIGEG